RGLAGALLGPPRRNERGSPQRPRLLQRLLPDGSILPRFRPRAVRLLESLRRAGGRGRGRSRPSGSVCWGTVRSEGGLILGLRSSLSLFPLSFPPLPCRLNTLAISMPSSPLPPISRPCASPTTSTTLTWNGRSC